MTRRLFPTRRLVLFAIAFALTGCSSTDESDSGREIGGEGYTWSAPVTLAGTPLSFLSGPDASVAAFPEGVVFGSAELRPISDGAIWVKIEAESSNQVVRFSPGTRVGARYLTGDHALINLDRAEARVRWNFAKCQVLFEERFPGPEGRGPTRWHFGRTTVHILPDGYATYEHGDGTPKTLRPGQTLVVPPNEDQP